MASLPTREASRAASAAVEAWRDHRRSCVTCERAANRRIPRDMCARGRQLNADRAECDRALRAEREKDKAPNPDQGALIEMAEFRSLSLADRWIRGLI